MPMDHRRLERLIDLGHSLVAEQDADAILDRVLRTARDLTGAQHAGLAIEAPDDPSALAVPVAVRGQALGTLYVTDPIAGEFTAEDRDSLGIMADWAALLIAHVRMSHEVRGFAATTELARMVGGEIELQAVLDLIAARALTLVEGRTAVVILPYDAEITVEAVAGDEPAGLRGATAPIGPAVRKVLTEARPVQMTGLRENPGARVAALAGAHAGLYVPLVYRGQAIAVLVVFDPPGRQEFSAEDERLLAGFAASAANAVATVQNAAERSLRRAIEAAEEERRRWARELHDGTLQHLGGIRMLLSAARRSSDPEILVRAIDDAMELLQDGIAELRSLVTDLRPAALDELGIGPALTALADRVRRVSGLTVDLGVHLTHEEGREPERHEASLESAVYRIVQEALTNVVRHADATRAFVEVVEDGPTVVVTVRDDGRGFAVRDDGGRFGLIGMHERASLVGGRLTVESAPGGGTEVRAELPARPRTTDSRD